MKKADSRFSLRLDLAMAYLALVLVAVGCAAGTEGQGPSRGSTTQAQPGKQEPVASQFGPGPAKIVSINPELRFVVIDFSSHAMPSVGTRLNVYRGEKRIGAVQITEPVRAQLATADVVEGDLRVGDEAR